ncbi:MAG TPA: TonB-dependent receptor [Acidobacteriaceae bacterium]|nr:TonB-dependent receptor [Acidobacteriaceae bacterium]
MPLRPPIRLIAALLACGLVALPLAAAGPDASTGSLEGRLTDTHSLPLVQAQVVLHNLTTGATARAITGKNGSYHFAGLRPGEYRLDAELPELGHGAVEGILVSAGHATRMRAALRMELPAAPSLVELSLDTPDPVSPAVTASLSSEELNSLPVEGRDWQAIEASVPTAAPVVTEAGHDHSGIIAEAIEATPDQDMALTGITSELESTAIDGMADLPSFHPEASRHGQPTGADSPLGPSAVESFQARITAEPADGGPGIAGGIGYRSARGHNSFHGQVFYLNRESLWGAHNPFTQWIQQTASVSGISIAQFTPEPWSPANSQQTFGLGLGKALRRNQLWWFAALDGRLRSDPAVATVRHPDEFFAQPTNDELQVLAARLNLPGPSILEEGAAAYSTGLAGIASVLGPVPRRADRWQSFARIDWQITDRQHLNVESGYTREDATAGAIRAASATFGSHSFGNSQAADLWQLAQWQSFLTPNLLNALAAEYRSFALSDAPQSPSPFEAPLLANSTNQLPEIIADSKYGVILGKPARLTTSRYPFETLFTARDGVSWVHGSHLLRAGAAFDHAQDATHSLLNQSGTYSYADVLNFLSDRASFLAYGLNATDNPAGGQHNCDATGRVHASSGTIFGLGPLPCYAWFTQTIGPTDWRASTNNLAGFVSDQWQPAHNFTLSAGLRVESEQLPPPVAFVQNPALPQTGRLPDLGVTLAPRIGLAWQLHPGTVLRAGGGLYYGRLDNTTLLAALSQTGSLKGDLHYFFKPTDTGAPPFPYAFSTAPANAVTPGATAFAPHYKQQEVDQAIVSLEQQLPSHWVVSVTAMASLGRRLPISIDTNLKHATVGGKPQTITYSVVDSLKAGPLKGSTVTEPLYTERPDADYQQISTLFSRANSTYEAAMIRLIRYGGKGLNIHAHYLYAHATDWNPNETAQLAGNDVLDPDDFSLEYGTSNLDIRSSAGITVLYRAPWRLQRWQGAMANGWGVGGIGSYHSGLPFTMRVAGYIPGYYSSSTLIQGVGPGVNGSAGDNRLYEVGRNTYRYPATWNGNLRLSRRFDLHNNRQLELLAESFNLFNHQNVTQIETTGYYIYRGPTSGGNPTLNFMTGLAASGKPSLTSVEFGKPLNINATDYFRPREIQLGLRARF